MSSSIRPTHIHREQVEQIQQEMSLIAEKGLTQDQVDWLSWLEWNKQVEADAECTQE